MALRRLQEAEAKASSSRKGQLTPVEGKNLQDGPARKAYEYQQGSKKRDRRE
jgi:hypothetical protein